MKKPNQFVANSLLLLKVIANGVELKTEDDLVNNEVSPDEFALSFPRVSRKTSAFDGNIEKIDVKCDTSNGMIVEVEFAEIFNGLIYSQGYYNDPKCKYVVFPDIYINSFNSSLMFCSNDS